MNLPKSALNSLFTALSVLFIPESLKFVFDKSPKDFATLSIPSAALFALPASNLLSVSMSFVIPDKSGDDIFIPLNVFSELDNTPISFENFLSPEMFFENSRSTEFNVDTRLFNDFDAWSASADTCIFKLSTVPSGT